MVDTEKIVPEILAQKNKDLINYKCIYKIK